VPSLATLLRFTLPTLGIWLAGPIMSLVDTSVVGLRSSIELAAMGPATNVCDSMLVSRSQRLPLYKSQQ
jgi:Na+-driven multidrug efflux pump